MAYGLAVRAVEARHPQPGDAILLVADEDQVLGRAPHAVLGREERDRSRAARIRQQRDGVLEPRADGGLVGEHAEAAAAQESEPVMDEHVETGLDARDSRHRGRV